jgi:hypothetical protein
MWCLDYRLPKFTPNPTDSCGRPRGDSSDQTFVVHHVRVGVSVELFGILTPITSSQSFRGSKRYYCSKVSEFSKFGSCLSSHLGKTLLYPQNTSPLENPSLPTKTLLPWTTLFFSSSLLIPYGNRYLRILRVKAIAVSVRLQIYLFALTNTNRGQAKHLLKDCTTIRGYIHDTLR